MKKIVFIVNTLDFFNSHRLPIALEAINKGYIVEVISNTCSGGSKNPNITYHHVGFSRSGQNPFWELGSLFRLFFLLVNIKPDLVHLVTIKPVLYGGIAARLAGVKSVVAAISGLGSVFSARRGVALLRLKIVRSLYKVVLVHNNVSIIFQNECDKEKLLSFVKIPAENVYLIPGSGVSLDYYPYTVEPTQTPVVSMAARLLKEKGVCEFVGAARLLKQRGVKVVMRVIGAPDEGNPSSVSEDEILEWEKENIVEFLGHRNDVGDLYSKSNIVCLPSYYGEGLPKSLVEAAACGRVVITTDMPGCRDAIVPSVTGLLVPPRNEVALADAIEFMLGDSDRRKTMGEAGRLLAEKKFTIESVVETHMDIYKGLIFNAS